LIGKMRAFLDGETAGDPMSKVKWSRKSTRKVGKAIGVSHTKARHLMTEAGYRLRFNRKRLARQASPDRETQFAKINALRASFLRRGQPVISVDAKKRELVGLFKNAGRAWSQKPTDVNMYDFPSDAEGVAIPYGVYDVGRGDGFIVIGTSHNTAGFAGSAIGLWWTHAGRAVYPQAWEVLVLADSGSSNGIQVQGWKTALQRFAERSRLRVTVAHYPTGASKWNPVEHRLFSAISNNWAGEPLRDYNVIKRLIRSTRTPSGSRCRLRIDHHTWLTQKQIKALSRDQEATPSLTIRHARTLPRLNYTISPSTIRAD
jgi:hypothetical protein